MFLVPLVGWYGFSFLFPSQVRVTTPMVFAFQLPPPEVPLWLLVVPYGAWWALGVAAHPYSRVRDVRAMVGYALAYFGVWLLVTRVLFAPGPLESLR